MQPETPTCCGKAKHGVKHTLLTLMRRRRRLIVSGEGQEAAVINAHISASSAKHSAVNLTDDTASLPPPPCFSDWDEIQITRGRLAGWSLPRPYLVNSAARAVQTYFSLP